MAFSRRDGSRIAAEFREIARRALSRYPNVETH